MSELSNAIKQVCEEKNLSYEAVVATIEQALAAAYRKDFGEKNQNIKVEFDPETAKSKVFDVKTVVEDMPEEEDAPDDADSTPSDAKTTPTDANGRQDDAKNASSDAKDDKTADGRRQTAEPEKSKGDKIMSVDTNDDAKDEAAEGEEERKFNPKTEIQLSDAKLIKKRAKIGDEIKTKLEVPAEYGRMAAQTAKQVIIQRLREAEREMVFSEFKDKEKEVVSGVVQRREGRNVLVDLGKSVGFLSAEEQIMGEKYNPGERVKVFIKEVRMGSKGAEIILSRTSDEILKKVFYLEIPEISNGLVELKAVAREAGSRSKVAVWTDSDNVDPIGSCVGQRGARIQTIISELGGEKVDIISYDDDPVKFIANALSPAKISGIKINEKERKATVKVAEDQLSLAIGKNGQNARLAARLTGWRIDIVGDEGKKDDKSEKTDKDTSKDAKKTPKVRPDTPIDAKSDKRADETKDDKKANSEQQTASKDGEKENKGDKAVAGDDEKKDKKDKKLDKKESVAKKADDEKKKA